MIHTRNQKRSGQRRPSPAFIVSCLAQLAGSISTTRRRLAGLFASSALLVGAGLVAPAGASAGWVEPASTPLTGTQPSIAGVGKTVWLDYLYGDRQVGVAQLRGGGWQSFGPFFAPPQQVASDFNGASITMVGHTPYAIWAQARGSAFLETQIVVMRYRGGGVWTQVGNPLNPANNKSVSSPAITSVGGVPYIAWEEQGKVLVARLKGNNTWTPVGDSLNVDKTKGGAFDPSITSIGGVPHVAWVEQNGTATQIHAANLRGAAWNRSRALNAGPKAYYPTITGVGNTPYVSWVESPSIAGVGQVWVAHRRGGGVWTGSMVESGAEPTITGVDGVPYLAFVKRSGNTTYLHVDLFDGHRWRTPFTAALNIDLSQSAGGPSITSIGGIPYVAWGEAGRIHVKYLQRLRPFISPKKRNVHTNRRHVRLPA